MRRSAWSVAFGLFLVGALLGSATTALLYPEVDRSPISNSTLTIPVAATVQRRPARGPMILPATVRAPVVVALLPNSPATGQAAGGREVVSGKTRKVGEILRYGDLVAEVSGRPVFAMPPTMPLYRDIEPAMTGSDVAALQKLLADRGYFTSAVNGTFGSGTLDALSRMFDAAGYDVPKLASGKPGLALANTTTLPRNGVRVIKAPAVGALLSTSTSAGAAPPANGNGDGSGAGSSAAATAATGLADVEILPAAVTTRVDLLQAKAFKVGGAVSVMVGAAAAEPSTVESVSGFRDAEASIPAGYDIVVRLPAKLVGKVKADDAATITEVTGAVPKGPAVPLVSIRQDDKGVYVMLAGPDGSPAGARRVAVTVRGQSDGYAILDDNADLPEGAVVLVNGAG